MRTCEICGEHFQQGTSYAKHMDKGHIEVNGKMVSDRGQDTCGGEMAEFKA